MRSLRFAARAVAVFVVGCSTADTPLVAPPLRASRASGLAPSSYIVTLRNDAGPSPAWATAHGVAPTFVAPYFWNLWVRNTGAYRIVLPKTSAAKSTTNFTYEIFEDATTFPDWQRSIG